MKVAIVYVYPLGGVGKFFDRAIRFLQSYSDRPPGCEHDSVIVCNGSPADEGTQFLFSALPNVRFIEHDNSGWDVGGFQRAARESAADMIVLFGAETYFRRPGWLIRMKEVFQKYGSDHLYGATGHQGDSRFNVWPHVRTTAFWCSPKLLNDCPMRATINELRYPFEHGEHGLTSWVLNSGKRAWIVGWDIVVPVQLCDAIPEGYHSATQANVLVGDRMTCPPFAACE